LTEHEKIEHFLNFCWNGLTHCLRSPLLLVRVHAAQLEGFFEPLNVDVDLVLPLIFSCMTHVSLSHHDGGDVDPDGATFGSFDLVVEGLVADGSTLVVHHHQDKNDDSLFEGSPVHVLAIYRENDLPSEVDDHLAGVDDHHSELMIIVLMRTITMLILTIVLVLRVSFWC